MVKSQLVEQGFWETSVVVEQLLSLKSDIVNVIIEPFAGNPVIVPPSL